MPRARQGGAIMVICLVILFSMTLIAVSSMDTAVLELRMANTVQQQIVALNRAEATLQSAEAAITTMVTDNQSFGFANDDGFYVWTHAEDFEQADWSGFTAEPGPEFTNNNVDDDDSYVVEYLGFRPDPKSCLEIGCPELIYAFRTTTRSASGRSIVRMVQSVFLTNRSPHE